MGLHQMLLPGASGRVYLLYKNAHGTIIATTSMKTFLHIWYGPVILLLSLVDPRKKESRKGYPPPTAYLIELADIVCGYSYNQLNHVIKGWWEKNSSGCIMHYTSDSLMCLVLEKARVLHSFLELLIPSLWQFLNFIHQLLPLLFAFSPSLDSLYFNGRRQTNT